MKPSIRLALILALILYGCGGKRVTVVQFEPQGEVQELQSFTIRFSEDLAPTGELDQWVSEEYLHIEPPIAGRYKWLSPNTLLFSPDRALQPSQEYTARINASKVLAHTQKKGKFDTYTFHTPFFQAQNVEFFWKQIPRREHEVSVQANISFNYEVDPNELKKYLSIKMGDTEITNYTIETEEPAKVIAINLGDLRQSEEAQKFQVEIRKGLTSLINHSPLAEAKSFEFNLPGISRLAVISTNSGFDGDKGWLEIHTTQPVDDAQLSKFISLTPRPAKLNMSTVGNRIRITGNMAAGNQIALKIKPGLPGLYGGKLEEGYEENVLLADLEPELQFADRKGTYLMRGGMENIRIEATNVPEARLQVYEVFKNNLLFFFYHNYDYRNLYYYNQNDLYDEQQYYEVSYYGKKLYDEKLEFEKTQNLRQSKSINLSKALDQRFKGVYVVQLNSEEDYWRRDAKLVAISDIGLIAKYSGSELLVFANSLKTAQPLEGVTVQLISENNQTLVSGTTGADGVAHFTDLKDDVEGFQPRLLTAELGEDFNFVDLEATHVETSRFDVGGKFVSDDSYDCFVYAERNIFRPGETANLSAIIREPDMRVASDIPVTVKVISPQGKTFNEYQKTLNEEGSFELAVAIPDFAPTGQYTAEFYTGSDDLLASYTFSVEEFAPDKIRVNLQQNKDQLKPGEELELQIEAEYLFGAPAAEHRYEVDVRLDHRAFSSSNFPQFNFSNFSTKNSYLDNDFSDGTLDENGKAVHIYTLPGNIRSGGYLLGRSFVSVFDVTGRTVNRVLSFKAFPRDYFPGIRARGYYYGTNKDITFELVAVNPDDQAIPNFEGEVSLIRYEWATVLERNTYNGRFRYRSVQKEIKEWTKNVKLTGKPLAYKFQVSKSGRYEFRFGKSGSDDYVKKQFYAYRWGSSTASSFEINKEGEVEIVMDKEEYAPGEQAKVLFVTPFTGRMLLTLERGKVLEHRYIDITENSTEVPITLGNEHVPNVFISATLFRPQTADDNIPFLVGHGYACMRVVNPSNKLQVSIQAPEKIKPRTSQEVTIKTNPNENIFVTLAAVDEGILQVKNFQTPDPYNYMYARRGLGVQSYDLYEYLLPEIAASSSPAGGDEESAARRLNPVKAERFKLLSQWSGIRRTNAQGEVTVKLDIPQYNGEVRLMAVAYQGARFGSAAKAMKVADDVILMPAVPRFLSINDSLSIPVSVMNTTGRQGEVRVNMKVEGPLQISSAKSASVQLAPNGSGKVNFVLHSGENVGTAKIVFSTAGMDEVVEEIEIGVRPISPLVTDADGGSIAAGSTARVQFPADFIPATQRSSISISNFPAIRHAKHLKYLVGYPHGCVEQTTSKLFPQLYFQELAAQVAPDMYVRGNPVYYVKEGIHKLQSMARYDGSFAYWPGSSYYNWWGSVYATHFLVEARHAGFVVNDDILQKALTFLNRKAADRSSYEYRYYENGNLKTRTIANKEILYSLYVLALAGKPDVSIMNYYRARPQLLSNDMRYLLAGAFALAKDYNAYNELVPKSFSAERAARTTGDSFDSEARANALMLNVLLDVDPSNKDIPAMLRYLTGKDLPVWSTQDRAWTFLALGKAAKRQADSDVSVEVQVDGKTLATLNQANPRFASPELDGKSVTLKASGKGETFYLWQSEGIKKQGVTEEVDKNIQVRRTYYDRDGREISGPEFRQGDLIVCRISLTGGRRTAENIAITDMIPAGFEIENPRLTPSADLSWINKESNRFSPDYLDVRDDRLLIYTQASANATRHFFYLLRVVNAGSFQLPAIGAEAMYDPDYRSYHGGKVIRVR